MNPRQRAFTLILMMYLQYKISAYPPLPHLQYDSKFAFLLLVHLYLGFLRTIRHPLPYMNLRMRAKLLGNVRQERQQQNDVYAVLVLRPFDFWILSGETLVSFRDLMVQITPLVQNFRYGDSRLTLNNRLLLTLIWLRQYPTYSLLSLAFGVSVSTIGETIEKMWTILWEICAPKVEWPDVHAWQQLTGTWPEMSHVVGCIDGTSHEILMPSTEPQEEFYSGHRKYHCMHTQVKYIVQTKINMCNISGFPIFLFDLH